MPDSKNTRNDEDLKKALSDLKGTMRDMNSRMVSGNITNNTSKNDDDTFIESEEERKENQRMHGLALRIPAEIIAGTVIGYFVGNGLDNMLETGKVFTIIFLLLGNTAAFLNIVRSIRDK